MQSKQVMKTVFVALAQHNHYSDVLRGKFLPALAEHFRVVVITPGIDVASVRRDGYFEHPNVTYERLPLAYPRFWNVMDKFIRVPLNREFDHLVYMRFFYQRPHWWPRKVLMRMRVLFPRGLFSIDRIARFELAWIRPPGAFLKLVEEYHPSVLITATPGFKPFEAEVIMSAKKLGLATFAIDINYDNLTSNGKMMRKTDFLAVWNERMKEEAKTLHRYRDDQLFVAGSLRFDHYFTDRVEPSFPTREEFLRSKGLDPGKKTIVWAGPTPSNYPPRKEFMTDLIRLKEHGAIDGDPNILVRIHPNDRIDFYREFSDRAGIHIERASRETKDGKVEMDEGDAMNLTATLLYADVVLNFASTVAFEAWLFDRPVINVAFPDWRGIVYGYEYNKYIVATRAVRLAESPDDLARLVNQYLREPALDRVERAHGVEQFSPFTDGETWRRTVAYCDTVSGGSV